MNWFYIVVSSIAVIILILSLAFVGVMMKKSNTSQSFPSSISQCPDLWIPDGSFCHFNGVNNGTYNISTDPKQLRKSNGDAITLSATEAPFFTNGYVNANYSQTTTINPFDEKWNINGVTPSCNQKQWAVINNIQWTGVREYNSC
jgi:hypothetical protein